jgi:hypothetical protein
MPEVKKPPEPLQVKLSADMLRIVSADGSDIAEWPAEYSREFIIRLLEGRIEQPKETIAYATLRDNHPAVFKEAMKRLAERMAAKGIST